MPKLLLDEPPLVIQPSLAKLIGLNEAIFLQQIHYWLQRSKKEIDGRVWTYHSVAELEIQFPFWSASTIKRTIKSLQESGVLLLDRHNKNKFDKTNWFAVDYEVFEELSSAPSDQVKMTQSKNGGDPIEEVKMTPSEEVKMTRSLIDTETTETTKKKKEQVLSKKTGFSLGRQTAYINLSEEYQRKLRGYAAKADGAYQLKKFLDHHIAKRSKFADWSRAYNTWVTKAESYDRGYTPENYVRALTDHPHHDVLWVEYGTTKAWAEDMTTIVTFEVCEQQDISTSTQRRDVHGLLAGASEGCRP